MCDSVRLQAAERPGSAFPRGAWERVFRVSYSFSASAPPIISNNSLVICPCRARL